MVIQQALQPAHHGGKFELRALPETGMGFVMPAQRSQYGWSLNDHKHHALQDAQKDEDQRVREEEYHDNDDKEEEEDSYDDDDFTFSLLDSTDFNFSSTNLQYEPDSSDQAFSGPFSPTMSHADELFQNGKIRPLFNITPMLNEATIITAATPNHQHDQNERRQPISTAFQAISVYEEPPQTATVKVCDGNQDDYTDPEAIYYSHDYGYGDYEGLYGHGYVPSPYIGGHNGQDDCISSNGNYCVQNQSSALMDEEGLQHYIYRHQQFIEEAIVRRSVAPEVAIRNVIVRDYADDCPAPVMARVDVHNVQETGNAGPYGAPGGNPALNRKGYNDHSHYYEGIHLQMEGAHSSISSETRTLRKELEENGRHFHPNKSSETRTLRGAFEEDDHQKINTTIDHKKIKGSLKELLRVKNRLLCTQALRRRKQQVMNMIKLKPIRRRPARVNHHDQSTISSSNSLINGHNHVHREQLSRDVITPHYDSTKRPSSASASASYSSSAPHRYASHPMGRGHPKSAAKARRLATVNPPFPNQDTLNRSPHAGTAAGARRHVSSPHDYHYTANRAHAKKLKKQTFLPYRPQLLACLTGRSA